MTGEYKFIYFLAVVIAFMWARFILMLKLTRTFGPMLTIIAQMLGKVGKFLFIWFVILSVLSSVASLLFGGIDSYSSFTETFFLMFGTGLGNYELGDFDDWDAYPPMIGKFAIVICVIINSIVLLNFIIAILSDTYASLSQKSLGLYYDGII